ncbi:beta-galactosidase [Enterococcus termitis]|uniref:Beta-galactosidase n=1 Tax=Enterococcus termitis TaxID=332950 RepID=A0A1E5GAQ6_9ENTE|nr:beta-galactosidase [Enterococcus termitis]OEG09773.1 beta-galactosidase [Enterococcus termitis]OJG96901.1 beta-galactosidase [Enterococcus termitis]
MRVDKERRFLHGGDYNPDQWLNYPEILEDDFKKMKQAKINTVTVGVFSWYALEPEEGIFQFDWLDDVFEKVSQLGGNVILATPSGGRPQWLSERYPEVNRTNSLGEKHTHGFRHNHCYSSPVYREKVQRINRKLAERYGNHPALSMWHVSNEYSGECYCSYCQENWRKWVKNKYKTLDNVNEAWWMNFWGSRYSSWSQVLPPNPLGETKIHGMDLDWKRFVTDQTIDFYLAEIEPLREVTPDVPVTTNFMAEGHDAHDFIPLEGIDYGKFAKYVDIVSWDSYPDWHNNYESLAETAMKSAYVHDQYWSLKQQPFLVMESTPSAVNWHSFNKSKRPGVHMLSSFQQLAHGSDSTLYFQWRKSRGNSEKFHGAVVDHDNSAENRVFKEVAEYGKRLEKLAEIKGSKKEVRVAIIFDWDSNWALKRGGGFGRPTRRYPQTLQEHYAVFWEQDIPVDIITSDHPFENYDLVIAPMLYLLREETMQKLENYVLAGGTLVSSYFTGMVNEADLLNIGGWPEILQRLFGLKPLELDILYPEESNQILYKNKVYRTKDYSTVIDVSTGQELAIYQQEFYAGTAAVVQHTVEQGETYFIAARTGKDFLRDFYRELIEKLDLRNDLVEVSDPEVSIQKRVNDQQAYYFIMNFSSDEKTVFLTKNVQDMENDEIISGNITVNPYEVRVVKERRANTKDPDNK